MPAPSLRVLLLSAEVSGLARTGGLGDVAAALTDALAALGADVALVTPRYGVSTLGARTAAPVGTARVRMGRAHERDVSLALLETRRHRSGGRARTFLLDDPPLFDRAGIYGDAHGLFGDNDFRFAVFGRGALSAAATIWPASEYGRAGPDVLSAHDWHTALAVVDARCDDSLAMTQVPSLFTIHNVAFQGDFDLARADVLGIDGALVRSERLEHFGRLNLMKGAITTADWVSTVSITYAREICTAERGFGLDGVLRARGARFVGIVNGIDTDAFDPRTDRTLAAPFDPESIASARATDKEALARAMGLEGDAPLFATVSRLTRQKGIDLLVAVAPQLVARGGALLVVGQGDRDQVDALTGLARRFPRRVAFVDAFDESLARSVYAGADFFVVPSRFEPCGLTQLYAMRYGAVPVVADVGGLHDTVDPIDAASARGTGIRCAPDDSAALFGAVESALALYADADALLAARRRGMATDVSWSRSAASYLELFEQMARARRA